MKGKKKAIEPLRRSDIQFLENGPKPIVMNTVFGVYIVVMLFFWFAPSWFRELDVVQSFIQSMSFADSVQITRDWAKQGAPIENGALMTSFTVFYVCFIIPVSVFILDFKYGYFTFLNTFSAAITSRKKLVSVFILFFSLGVIFYFEFGYDSLADNYEKRLTSGRGKNYGNHFSILFYGICFVVIFACFCDIFFRMFFNISGKHNLVENDKILNRLHKNRSEIKKMRIS